MDNKFDSKIDDNLIMGLIKSSDDNKKALDFIKYNYEYLNNTFNENKTLYTVLINKLIDVNKHDLEKLLSVALINNGYNEDIFTNIIRILSYDKNACKILIKYFRFCDEIDLDNIINNCEYLRDCDDSIISDLILNNENGYKIFIKYIDKFKDIIIDNTGFYENINDVIMWVDIKSFKLIIPFIDSKDLLLLNLISNKESLIDANEKINILIPYIEKNIVSVELDNIEKIIDYIKHGINIFTITIKCDENTNIIIDSIKSHIIRMRQYVRNSLKDILLNDIVDIIKSFVNI